MTYVKKSTCTEKQLQLAKRFVKYIDCSDSGLRKTRAHAGANVFG